MSEKRKRGNNFSFEEKQTLVSLVNKYREIINNKLTDAVTWKEKEKAWEDIASEMNSRNGFYLRTAKELRAKWQNLKKKTRKDVADERIEIFKTGGGRANIHQTDPINEQIRSMISLSVDGLKSIFDSDLDLGQAYSGTSTGMATSPISEDLEERSLLVPEVEYEKTDREERPTSMSNSSNWSSWNPRLLKTPKSSALLASPPPHPSTSAHDCDVISEAELDNPTNEFISHTTLNIESNSVVNKRPSRKRRQIRTPSSEASLKFAQLAEQKLERLEQQRQLLAKEAHTQEEIKKQSQYEHTLKMDLLKQKHELKIKFLEREHQIKMEIFQTELETKQLEKKIKLTELVQKNHGEKTKLIFPK